LLPPLLFPGEEDNLNNPHLELRGVRKEYAGVVAVDTVDLEVARGEFLVLLGPSGSGKTTILSMMGGFTVPTDGHIHIDGYDVTETPPAHRPTATVFQDYALFPHMSVLQNVSFGLMMRKVSKSLRRQRAEASLETMGLSGLGNRGIHQLSGGQRQRVALARAIAVEPEVLLLDEPLGALDQKIRRQMQVELVKLQKTLGVTFVHVTHDQEEAMSIADNIALINNGLIEDYGPPDRVYLRPATLFAATFMGDSNIFPGEVVGNGVGWVEIKTQIGNLKMSGNQTLGAAVHVMLRPEHIKVGTCESSDTFSMGSVRIVDVTFQGTHRLCRAVGGADGAVEFLLRLSPHHAVSGGDFLDIYTPVNDVVLLTR